MKNLNCKHVLGLGIFYISIVMHIRWQQCTTKVQHPTRTEHIVFLRAEKDLSLQLDLLNFL